MTKKKIKILCVGFLTTTTILGSIVATSVSCAQNKAPEYREPVTSKENVNAKSLSFPNDMIAYEAKKLIDQNWIIQNINNLVNGYTELITNINDIINYNIQQPSNNQLKLNFTIAAEKTYIGAALNPNPENISLVITSFKYVNPLSIIKTTYTASELNFDPQQSGYSQKDKITNKWIYEQIQQNLFLDGDMSLITSENDIQIVSEVYANGSTIEFDFEVKPGKSYAENGQPTINPTGPFTIQITNFKAPNGIKKKDVNLADIKILNPNEFAYKQTKTIDADYIQQNLDIFFIGDTSLIKNANANEALKVNSTVTNPDTLTTRITINSGYWYDSQTGAPGLEAISFSYVFKGFIKPIEISGKPNFSIDGSGLTIFEKNIPIHESIAKITNPKQWIINNKDKLFQGSLEELDVESDVLNVNLTAEHNNDNKYFANSLKIDVQLAAGVSIIQGKPSTSPTNFTIFVINFDENISESVIEFINETKMDKIIDYYYNDWENIQSKIQDFVFESKTNPNTKSYAMVLGIPNSTDVNIKNYQLFTLFTFLRSKKIITDSKTEFNARVIDDKDNNDNTWLLKIHKNDEKMMNAILGLKTNESSNLLTNLNKYGFDDIEYFTIPITFTRFKTHNLRSDGSFPTIDDCLKDVDKQIPQIDTTNIELSTHNHIHFQIGNSFTAFDVNNNKLFNTPNLKYANQVGELTDSPFTIDVIVGTKTITYQPSETAKQLISKSEFELIEKNIENAWKFYTNYLNFQNSLASLNFQNVAGQINKIELIGDVLKISGWMSYGINENNTSINHKEILEIELNLNTLIFKWKFKSDQWNANQINNAQLAVLKTYLQNNSIWLTGFTNSLSYNNFDDKQLRILDNFFKLTGQAHNEFYSDKKSVGLATLLFENEKIEFAYSIIDFENMKQTFVIYNFSISKPISWLNTYMKIEQSLSNISEPAKTETKFFQVISKRKIQNFFKLIYNGTKMPNIKDLIK